MEDFSKRISKGSPPLPPRIVIIGEEGVGKSTAGLALPSPLFICAEDGLVGRNFKDTNQFHPTSWQDTLDHARWMAEADHPYKSYILDTVDWIEPLVISHILTRDKTTFTDISQYKNGAGYIAVASEFRLLISELDSLRRHGLHTMLLFHSKITNFSNPTGDDYSRFASEALRKVGSLARQWADLIIFAQFETITKQVSVPFGKQTKAFGGKRRLAQMEHSAAWDAKTRFNIPTVMEFDMSQILWEIQHEGETQIKQIIQAINLTLPTIPPDIRAQALTYLSDNADNFPKLQALLSRLNSIPKEGEK